MIKKLNNKTNAKNIIANRKELDVAISRNWTILAIENAVDKAYTRNYDLDKVFKLIAKQQAERIEYKLQQQCLNIGFTKRSQLSEEANYINIFTLSEKREMLVLLNKLARNLDGVTDKNTTDVHFDKPKLSKLTKHLELEISGLLKKIENFNAEHTLEIDSKEPTDTTKYKKKAS